MLPPSVEEAIERMMTLYPAWSRIVKEKLVTAGEDRVLKDLYDMTVHGPKRYTREFLERRVRTSITGLADYHARMEHAAPQH